ncbi:MFS transporter [Flexithrix dorotheae]|uniref:MFS transporter n=1 Tax=Flexithrix dorotheae TaxID=70993 RepID=UPI00035C90A9|nr:MFS transporter [Flexithrix dorotheae]
MKKLTNQINPWAWVPSLYLAEGLPYVMVNVVSLIMYKRLNVPNAEIAFYTSFLYFPWVIKPIWSPVVDTLKTKRYWILIMQLILGAAFAGVAFSIPTDNFFRYTLAFFWLMAFSSATHDIAADGFYMLGLSEHQQAYFVGIRSTFYRLAMITGQGFLVIMAGKLENHFGVVNGWTITFFVITALMFLFYIYHNFVLPRPKSDIKKELKPGENVLTEFGRTFLLFIKKDKILIIIGFLLLYRFGEAQLVKLASPFLLDKRDVGGLGLSTEEVGIVYGTVGLIALTIGGILGGFLVSKHGLKYWLWWMIIAINLPNGVYIYLSVFQPENFYIINAAVAIEQFGYGFGFTAYMMYMIYISEGPYKTAHFAIATGFMALGMMLPGLFSGWLQEQLGYPKFFTWVLFSAIPGFIITIFIPLRGDFGKKKENATT